MSQLVSIIIPVYNPGNYFERTITSILNQSYQNLEVIVIDDGSAEEYKNYISRVCGDDERIKLCRITKNIGGGKARNEGLRIIKGDFVAFCDSDDLWPCDKLEKQISFMIEKQHPMSHCDMAVINAEGEKLGYRQSSEQIDLHEFLLTTSLYCSSVVLRASIIGPAKFGEKRARHPFKFWCTLLRNGYISTRVPNTFFNYTQRKGSVSSNKFKMIFYTLYAYLVYSGKPFLAPYYLARRFL